jgi:hypothetical protein
MHLFDRARLIGGAGMVITAKLDPTTLSPKMRKSAAKQIREGIYLGYTSKAAEVAKKYLTHFKGEQLPACGIVWGAKLRVNKYFTYTPEILDEVRRLMEASASIYHMQYGGNERLQRDISSDIATLSGYVAWGGHNNLILSTYQKEISTEIAKYLSESRSDAQKEHAAWIADKVMQDECIPVIF